MQQGSRFLIAQPAKKDDLCYNLIIASVSVNDLQWNYLNLQLFFCMKARYIVCIQPSFNHIMM